MKKYILLLVTLMEVTHFAKAQEDKFLWLEEVDGVKALEFVDAQNAATFEKLSKEKDFQSIYEKSLEISNSTDRIAYPSIHGDYVYNFWKDENHERGIWRRSSLFSYQNGKPIWETLLDIDELSKQDDIKWVFYESSGLYPNYDRFLISLSKGGGDAVVIREFDVEKKQFIEEGFFIDEAKGNASYLDENTLVVSTDFGKGTMTTSGYPRQIKLWKRGTPIDHAKLIFEGDSTDVAVLGAVMHDDSKTYTIVLHRPNIFSGDTFVWLDDRTIKLDIPDDASINGILKNQVIIHLKSDWIVNDKTYKTGTLLSLNFNELIQGKKEIQTVLEPDAFSSIEDVQTTKNKLIINKLTNVVSELHIYSFDNDLWTSQKVNTPDFGTLSIVDTNESDDKFFFDFKNFVTPTTLFYADASTNKFEAYQSLPSFFDASKYKVEQFKATSKDGTMIPYFMVSSKSLKMDGSNPTLIYAYGGFEVSLPPFYSAAFGTSWLDKGGVFVLANIRGGGEYGPKWHQDGMKEKRQNVFDDLYAVTEDLISKEITSPSHLGVMGGSNGGLLVGVAFTQRPDLYNAVVCQVPLLDMKRYNKLLAGASWMGEYGNPDIPEDWEYIKKYSPYQNLKEGEKYPEVFFTTSTRDDRVHPGHARKMVAKMNDMGYKTYYFENTEGGHAGSSTNEQRAKINAMEFTYLLMKLR